MSVSLIIAPASVSLSLLAASPRLVAASACALFAQHVGHFHRILALAGVLPHLSEALCFQVAAVLWFLGLPSVFDAFVLACPLRLRDLARGASTLARGARSPLHLSSKTA
eukprot:841692-Pyramimonas_sp.AAC.1